MTAKKFGDYITHLLYIEKCITSVLLHKIRTVSMGNAK